MFIAKVKNYKDELLTLTQNEDKYQVISIEGLNPPEAQINTMDVSGMDGSRFNSSKLTNRNIVITIKLCGDVETNRIELYNFFVVKEMCTFYFKNTIRDVYAEGYVESVSCNPFENGTLMQISMICPYPYFKDVVLSTIDISNVSSGFTFPFSADSNGIPISNINTAGTTLIENDSDTNCGIVIRAKFKTNANHFEIENLTDNSSLKINLAFLENDELIINTNKGKKYVRVKRNGTLYNVFRYVTIDSVFLQLLTGENYLRYYIDGYLENFIIIAVQFNKLYRGA